MDKKKSLKMGPKQPAEARYRGMDPNQVVAYELPITWFFLPPPAWSDGAAVKLTTADARRYGTEIGLLLDLVFGDDDDQRKLLEARLSEFFEELGSDGLTAAQRRVGGAAELRAAAVVRHRLGDLDQWEAWLRTVADELARLRTDTAATAEEPESRSPRSRPSEKTTKEKRQ